MPRSRGEPATSLPGGNGVGLLQGLGALAVIVGIAACLWYVTAPPKGVDGYGARAAYTAETLRSQAQSARLTVDALAAGELPHAAALVGFEETETDAEAAASGFEAFEPPTGTGSVRDDFVSLAGDTTEALSALRIGAQQERWAEVPRLGEPLPGLVSRLDDFIERAQR